MRPYAVVNSQTRYRVEVVIKSVGKFKCRRPVGEGSDYGKDILINLWPYGKPLVLGKGEDCER